MFNPRLASGDVGVGLSIRRMRDSFLNRFTTTYSLRPIQDVGSVFRRYPGMWQVGGLLAAWGVSVGSGAGAPRVGVLCATWKGSRGVGLDWGGVGWGGLGHSGSMP